MTKERWFKLKKKKANNDSGGPGLSSAFTFTLPYVGGEILPDQARYSRKVSHSQRQSVIQKPLHHECLCAEPHQCLGQCLWASAGDLPTQPGSASAQVSTALPAQTVAAQNPSSVPISSFPLTLWAQAGGRMELDWGLEGPLGAGM